MANNLSNILWPGTRIYLATESISKMLSAAVLVDDEYIAITVPSKDGFFHPLAKGVEVEVSFFSGSGKYTFKSVITKRVLLNNYPVMLLELPKKLDRSERRQHYRMDILFPVKLTITELTGEADNIKVTQKEYKAKCADISTGGIMLEAVSSRAIPIISGTQMDIDFLYALDGLSKAKGVAVRPPKSETDGWGIQFTEITDASRGKISRYVNKKQIDMQTEGKFERKKKKSNRLERRR